MNILIIGGGGFIGQKLAHSLAARGHLKGHEIGSITLADIQPPDQLSADFDVYSVTCDVADPQSVADTIGPDVDVIYLLAAIVSAHAEDDFFAGMSINMMGTLNVLERARSLNTSPTVIFTSSIAVFGGDVPDPILDHTALIPQSSYGTQKAIGELLVNDYSRKGFIDGRGFRLPTISVRPGAPNRAASSFMSSILREPLNGHTANCPVSEDFAHYYLSPRKCVENLILGTEIPSQEFGQSRCLMMPGRKTTIREMIDAMTSVVGPEAERLITWTAEPDVQKIVGSWRSDFEPTKALKLGLSADASFVDNIQYYIADDQPKL